MENESAGAGRWPYTRKTKSKIVTVLEQMWREAEAKRHRKEVKVDYAELADIARCMMSIVEATVLSKKMKEAGVKRSYELEASIENGKFAWQLTGNENDALPASPAVSILYLKINAYFLSCSGSATMYRLPRA
ncbi:MAG: hypothetical protein ACP5HW_01105 [Candidatus Micrarchaeia archaeon]